MVRVFRQEPGIMSLEEPTVPPESHNHNGLTISVFKLNQ